MRPRHGVAHEDDVRTAPTTLNPGDGVRVGVPPVVAVPFGGHADAAGVDEDVMGLARAIEVTHATEACTMAHAAIAATHKAAAKDKVSA